MLAGWRQLQLCHLASEMRARRAEMRREGPPVLLVLLGLMEEAGECRDSLPEGSLPPPPHPHSDMVTPALSWWFLPLELTASHWSQGKPLKLSVWSSAPNPSSSSRLRARPQCSCAPRGLRCPGGIRQADFLLLFPRSLTCPWGCCWGEGRERRAGCRRGLGLANLGASAGPGQGWSSKRAASSCRGPPAHAEGRAPEPADASFWRFQPSLFRAPHTGPRALWDTGQVTASQADVGCHGTQGQTWFKEGKETWGVPGSMTVTP